MPVVASEEQQHIIHTIIEGKNVMTDSVAGSGKTTTILFLAHSLPQKRILVVTYNSRLKAETRERVRKNKIKNLEVHSYHSLGLQYYTNPCNTDTHLMNIVRQGKKPTGNMVPAILILDECQDMTKDYYFFIMKVIKDMNKPDLQLFVMGDHMQCIYDFLHADSRYLTLADKLFPSTRVWEKCTLKTSYRITKPMEHFVNDIVLGYPRMKAVKESSIPVKYYTGDPFFKVPHVLAQEIQMLLNTGKKPGEIFVLAPSIRTKNDNNPVKKFENLLVRMGIPCYVPLSDDEELRDEVTREKVVFSSYHQSKGLEREVVILVSFSETYYFIFKDHHKIICPNLVYVASTRAKEILYLWGENTGERPFPFLKKELLENNPQVETIKVESRSTVHKSDSPKEYNLQALRRVTDLVRFLPDESMEQILELCNIVTRKTPITSIQIPSTIATSGNKNESVSDLTGIAIPTIFEHRRKGYISIQNDLETFYIPRLKDDGQLTLKEKQWIKEIQEEPKTPADYLCLANHFSAFVSGYIHKVVQIEKYDWLNDAQVEELLKVLEENIHGDPKKMLFEETLSLKSYMFNNVEVQIEGKADLIDDLTLWELKCVESIRPEHIVQLALYAYIWQQTEYEKQGRRRFCIFNFRTGEILEITGVENLKMIVDIVLDNAFRTVPKLSDEEFLEMCRRGPDFKKVTVVNTVEDDGDCWIEDD